MGLLQDLFPPQWWTRRPRRRVQRGPLMGEIYCVSVGKRWAIEALNPLAGEQREPDPEGQSGIQKGRWINVLVA